MVPYGYLKRMAIDVANSVDTRIRVEDLIQVGYVVLIKSAESWISNGRSKEVNGKLITYAKKGIKSAMFKYAVNELKEEPCPTTGTHEEIKIFSGVYKPPSPNYYCKYCGEGMMVAGLYGRKVDSSGNADIVIRECYHCGRQNLIQMEDEEDYGDRASKRGGL